MKKIAVLILFIFSFIFLIPKINVALGAPPPEATNTPAPTWSVKKMGITVVPPTNLPITKIGPLISGSISFVLAIALLLAFVFLIWGGIQWMTSGGDKTAVEAARNRIQSAILGLFIVFAAWAIMVIVGKFFGMGFPNFTFQSGY